MFMELVVLGTLLLCGALLGLPLGYALGHRMAREDLRLRAEVLLRILDQQEPLPYVATRRAVAKLAGLPDPHPLTDPRQELR